MGRHGAGARREDAPRHALLQARLARRAVAQTTARVARDEPRPADQARQRCDGPIRRGDDRARGTRHDDREVGRRLPRVHPAFHLGVHLPPQQHQPDHRRADDPFDQLHPAGRVRRLARRRDAAAIVDRDTRRGRSRRGSSSSPGKVDARSRRDRRPRIDRGARDEAVLPGRGIGPRRAVPHDLQPRTDE